MIRSIFLFTLFVLWSAKDIQAQGKLWGTAKTGGKGTGFIYNFNDDGSNFNVAKVFDLEARVPTGQLLHATDGMLYGVTRYGGSFDGGTLFKVSNDGGNFEVLKHFNGEFPYGGLIEFGAYLYGITRSGGASDGGFVYKIGADGSDFSIIFEFEYGGNSFNGGLVRGFDQYVYGTSSRSSVFKIDLRNDVCTVVRDLGFSANGHLIENKDGFLYGTGPYGDAGYDGIIFKLRTDGTEYSVIKRFANYIEGRHIYGGLTFSQDSSSLYGVFSYGGKTGDGGIFKINADGSDYQVIHHFNGNDGNGPKGQMFLENQYLYGATESGVFFKIKTDGTDFHIIRNLDLAEGIRPSMIKHLNNIYYGAESGVFSPFGLVGKINLVNEALEILKHFNPIEGGCPYGKLLQHSNGFLYGKTTVGGKFGRGTLFEINPSNYAFEVLYDFNEHPASFDGGLIERENGKILGLVKSSAESLSSGCKIFEFDLSSNTYSIVFEYPHTISEIWESHTSEIYAADNFTPALLRINTNFTGHSLIEIPSLSEGAWVSGYGDSSMVMYGNIGPSSYSDGRIVAYDFSKSSLELLHSFNNSNLWNCELVGGLSIINHRKLIGVKRKDQYTRRGMVFTIEKDGTEFTKNFDFPSEYPYPTGGITKVSDSLFFGIYSDQYGNSGVYKYDLVNGFSVIKEILELSLQPIEIVDGLSYSQSNTPRVKLYGNMDFGEIEIEKSKNLSLRLKNSGTGILMVNDIILPEGFFVTENSFVLANGAVKEIEVEFRPTEPILYTGKIQILSDADENGLNAMPISGKGYKITGISDGASADVQIYSNSSHIQIKSKSKIESVALISCTGKQLYRHNQVGKFEAFIDGWHRISPGVYVIIIRNGDGFSKRKIVKL